MKGSLYDIHARTHLDIVREEKTQNKIEMRTIRVNSNVTIHFGVFVPMEIYI